MWLSEAIGNAYPSFQSPRKYLSPGLFGPCGYGFPSILGAKVWALRCRGRAQVGNPHVPVVGFAGDGAFGISMNELTACGRGDWPPVTMVVFRNFQWGAEKRNTTLWYDDNFVGTELNKGPGHTVLLAERRQGWSTRPWRKPAACGA